MTPGELARNRKLLIAFLCEGNSIEELADQLIDLLPAREYDELLKEAKEYDDDH